MKNWLWFLGISAFSLVACQEQDPKPDNLASKPSIDSVVGDSQLNLEVVQALDSPTSQEEVFAKPKDYPVQKPPQDTQKRYPIIHIGDKDFDPNKYLGPDATESQRAYARKMIAQDSLRRLRKMHQTADSLPIK